MKSFGVFVLCILLVTQDNHLLKKKSVGSLKIGCDVTAIYDIFDKEKETSIIDKYEEATFTPAIQVTKGGELLFVGDINCSAIRSFEIFSSKYRTSTGISVGSNFAKLKTKHNLILDNREGNLVAVVKELEMVFLLEQTKKIQLLDLSKVTIKDIPDDVKIASIIVY
jgi:hypothetical protein